MWLLENCMCGSFMFLVDSTDLEYLAIYKIYIIYVCKYFINTYPMGNIRNKKTISNFEKFTFYTQEIYSLGTLTQYESRVSGNSVTYNNEMK